MSDGPSKSEIIIVLAFLGVVISRVTAWVIWPSVLAIFTVLVAHQVAKSRDRPSS